MTTLKKPIYATAQDAENAFYEAMEKADLELMMGVWAEDEEVVCVHPGGPRLAGLANVMDSWKRIFQAASRRGIPLRVSHAVHMQGMLIAIHSVHENDVEPGSTAGAIVATNVFVRGGLGWRMVAHHASPAPAPAEPAAEAPKILH